MRLEEGFVVTLPFQPDRFLDLYSVIFFANRAFAVNSKLFGKKFTNLQIQLLVVAEG
jgi:hypothetical protein